MDNIEDVVLVDPENRILDLIDFIEYLNKAIEELKHSKEMSEKYLSSYFETRNDGSITHKFKNKKITFKNDYSYSVDMNKYDIYLNGIDKIDNKFQVIKEVYAFKVDKKELKNLEHYGSDMDRYLSSSFIVIKPSKMNVKITTSKEDI